MSLITGNERTWCHANDWKWEAHGRSTQLSRGDVRTHEDLLDIQVGDKASVAHQAQWSLFCALSPETIMFIKVWIWTTTDILDDEQFKSSDTWWLNWKHPHAAGVRWSHTSFLLTRAVFCLTGQMKDLDSRLLSQDYESITTTLHSDASKNVPVTGNEEIQLILYKWSEMMTNKSTWNNSNF